MTYLKESEVGQGHKVTSSGVVRADISSPGHGGDNHEDRLLLQEDHQKVHALETAAIKPDPVNQFLSAAVVSGVATVSIGTVLGFSAILLPQLESEMMLSSDEKSWIASLSNIGQLFGAVATGILAGKLGRRITLMILCLPLLAGWVTTALAQEQIWVFYLGRVLQGVGVMSSVTQVYLVEIADTERRGLFGASGALSVSVGITLVYCLGVVCVICGLFPVVTFISMIFLPETPPWLVLHGRKEEAERVLKWLRGDRYDVSKELEALTAAQGGAGQTVSFSQTLKAFKYPGAYKPFSILLLVFIFQQLSGSYAVIFYAVSLFKNIGVSTSPYIPAIITGLIRLVGTLIGTALIKRFGRKPLMTLSAFLMGVFMTSLAVTVHYKEKFYHENCLRLSPNSSLPETCQNNTTSLQQEDGLETIKLVLDIWPAVSVILYMLVFGAGVGTIPWLLLGELCPSKVKGIASGVTVSVAFVMIFAVVKIFPYGLEYLSPAGTYGFFAGVSVLMGIFTILAVPETRGKSLSEIQTMFGELEPRPAPVTSISGEIDKEK